MVWSAPDRSHQLRFRPGPRRLVRLAPGLQQWLLQRLSRLVVLAVDADEEGELSPLFSFRGRQASQFCGNAQVRLVPVCDAVLRRYVVHLRNGQGRPENGQHQRLPLTRSGFLPQSRVLRVDAGLHDCAVLTLWPVHTRGPCCSRVFTPHSVVSRLVVFCHHVMQFVECGGCFRPPGCREP